jgi:hypothetical protein
VKIRIWETGRVDSSGKLWSDTEVWQFTL